ncbi:putative ribonuclease H-like domain-containing protein [Tanacetum coccineum]
MDCPIVISYIVQIDEEVYVKQPPGFEDLNYPHIVYKVKKAMYGLHQAPRAWYGALSKSMIGSLMYLTTSRPDIMFAVPKMSPHTGLLGTLKVITLDFGAYSTSDYDGDNHDRKSTTGGCQFLDCYEKKLINVDHIHSDENVADLLTKPFAVGRFQYLVGEGSVNPTKPQHTPSPHHDSPPHDEQIYQFPQHEQIIQTTSHELPQQEPQITPPASLSQEIQITPTPRRMTKKAIRISQSKALSPIADETAPPTRGDRHGEAFPTVTSLDAGQDRENIHKTSTMPHDSPPRVTSLAGDEGSMKQKLNELMEFCTKLQSQQTKMVEKIHNQDLEISQLKAMIKTLENAQKTREGEFANVLSSMGAANVLASGSLKEVFTTASPPIPPVSSNVPTAIATASEKDPTAEAITTASGTTHYTRRIRASREVVIRSTSPIPIGIQSAGKEDTRKGKEIMIEPEKPTKAKVQEQMSLQLARDLQEEFVHEDQSIREQIERDTEIARIQAEEDLRQMIDELDRSNKVINKHMAEYEEAENELSVEEKTELITELIIYQKDLARIKKYQAQQQRGMTFDQIEEKFIPKVKAKRLKASDGSAQEQKLEDVKEKENDDQDKIINLQQWVVLVREETSVDITPSVVKTPIYDWKIYKDKLMKVYQIFRVGQAPKVYPYIETMLKEFDRDDMVTLWKLVKDRFEKELPKSDMERCLFWPLKVIILFWKLDMKVKYQV